MPPAALDPLDAISRLLQEHHGVDLSRFKPRCLMRRLQVRMRAVGAADLQAYATWLGSRPQEVQKLFEALSINFSFFFRDPGLFRILGESLLPELARAVPAGPLQLWSAGCAAGEELYSLGILAEQVLGPRDRARVQLLGTDLDEAALEEARAGIYPPSRLAFLDKSLIEQYFHPEAGGGNLRVVDTLRQRAEFRRADLLAPAPVSRVPLICCRNVMIYFEPRHQEQVLEQLTAALGPGGILALGRVERLVGPSRCRYEVVSTAERVFRKIAGGGGDRCS